MNTRLVDLPALSSERRDQARPHHVVEDDDLAVRRALDNRSASAISCSAVASTALSTRRKLPSQYEGKSSLNRAVPNGRPRRVCCVDSSRQRRIRLDPIAIAGPRRDDIGCGRGKLRRTLAFVDPGRTTARVLLRRMGVAQRQTSAQAGNRGADHAAPARRPRGRKVWRTRRCSIVGCGTGDLALAALAAAPPAPTASTSARDAIAGCRSARRASDGARAIAAPFDGGQRCRRRLLRASRRGRD